MKMKAAPSFSFLCHHITAASSTLCKEYFVNIVWFQRTRHQITNNKQNPGFKIKLLKLIYFPTLFYKNYKVLWIFLLNIVSQGNKIFQIVMIMVFFNSHIYINAASSGIHHCLILFIKDVMCKNWKGWCRWPEVVLVVGGSG